MNNSITAFLIIALCALSFVLGAKFFPKAPRVGHSIIIFVDAPTAITPISSKPGKPIKDTVWITKTQIDSIKVSIDTAIVELAKPFNLEFFAHDSNDNSIAYANVYVEPLTKTGIMDSLYLFPMKADSIPCPVIEESFDYWNALLYFGIGYVTHIIVKDL